MKKLIFFTVVVISLFSLISVLSAQESERGSIRGFIFQDTNGDGICQDGIPLPGVSIDLELASTGTKARVFSDKDGRYSVTSAAQGTWSINIFAANRRWGAVSPNPIQVEVSPSAGLVHSGINFCMQRGVNIPASPPPTVVETTVGPTLPEQSTALLTLPPDPIEPEPEKLVQIQFETLENKAIPVDQWLDYLNVFREMAGVPLVEEDSDLTFGAHSHSRYMVVHDRPIAHAEDPKYALYSEAGHIAGANGLIFATSQIQADHTWAFNFFVSAPFHLIPLLDPNLKTVGYGHYNEDVGNFTMAGVLDVRSGLQFPPDESIEYPIQFPGDGEETWVLRHSLFEWPNPIPSCPGFSRPSGPPIVLMLGDGDITPRVSRYQVLQNGTPIETCMFNETNFSSPISSEQSIGRTILDSRDAIVLMPKNPLASGSTYSVEIEVNGELHEWAFTTRKGPRKAGVQ